MSQPALRIILTADPYLPVPPRLYGGIERVIDLLARGLTARGHEVTLIAHPDSATVGTLVPYGVPPHIGWLPRARELGQLAAALWQRRGAVDVVHSFGRLASLLPLLVDRRLRRLPKVQSYQRQIPWRSVRMAARLAVGSLCLVSCSRALIKRHAAQARSSEWRCIYNAVELERYPFVPSVVADAPLVFLGRLERIKGVHNAIAIARAAGRRLVIAGNRVASGEDAGYFAEEVAPHVDGQAVTYVGPVDDAAKAVLLGGAAALLMPIEWEEPFGIVMAEALACGTPVIGYHRGSVPEVIKDGVTGFVCRSVVEAAQAVGQLDRIDRHAVRRDCAARFSFAVFVDQHEQLYRELVDRCAGC